MDDGNQTVGANGGNGAGGQPSQPVSQPPAQPIQGDVSQLLAGLESKFSEQFSSLSKELRGLQGRQDKSENTFRQQLAKMNQYKSQGLTDDEALAEMESDTASEARWTRLEQRLEDLAGRIAGVGAPANGQQQAVADVFSTIGLDLKDPRVAVAMTKQYKDADAIELAAYRLLRDTASPQSNTAQNASLQGSSSSVSVDNLLASMDSAMLKGDFGAMQEIEKQLKAAGAPGWN